MKVALSPLELMNCVREITLPIERLNLMGITNKLKAERSSATERNSVVGISIRAKATNIAMIIPKLTAKSMNNLREALAPPCLLYTSDAADE